MLQQLSGSSRCPAFAILLIACFAGCGRNGDPIQVNNANVGGKVLLNDKPIGPLSLQMYSDQFGKVAEIQVNKGGEIEKGDSIPAGGYMIALGPPKEGSLPSGVPGKYFIDTSSDLHYQITTGDNVIVVKLVK